MKKVVIFCGLLLAGVLGAAISVDYDAQTITIDGAEHDFYEVSGAVSQAQRQELKSFLEDKIASLNAFIDSAAANGNYDELPEANQKVGSLQTVVEMLGE